MRSVFRAGLVPVLLCLGGCGFFETIGEQKDIEVELFNDSGVPVHLLLDREARAPSNRVAPGQGRVTTTRFLRGQSLLVSAENSAGVDVIRGCTFVDEEFEPNNPFAGQISFSGSSLTCSGSAFE